MNYDVNFNKQFNPKITAIQNNINLFTKLIWIPHSHILTTKSHTSKYNDIHESKNFYKLNKDSFTFKLDKINDVKYIMKQIQLFPSSKHKLILNRWFHAFIRVYNSAIYYIKHHNKDKDFKLNFMYIRSKLYQIKKNIAIKAQYNIDNIKYLCGINDLDYAVKLACSNYQSALTNFKNGNIKHFRIRYWKYNKNNKIMDLSKVNFKKIKKVKFFDDMKAIYNGKEFDLTTINCDSRLIYNSDTNKYMLYVPIKIDKEEPIKNKNKNNFVSLDPGIRTFLTGFSEDKIVEIGKNINSKIKKYLERLDKINSNKKISKKIKRRNEKMINRKIKNQINEMHWKAISYLTSSYDNILIGDMSIKGIISKDGNLNEMTKRIGLKMSLFEFKERLKYKCNIRSVGYKEVDEYYTSKMCSNCGEINKKLGSKKVFECEKCSIIMDRDVNGSRGILIKGLN